MKIRRRSDADLSTEIDGLGFQLNKIRPKLWEGKTVLRSARGWLKEFRANAPPFNMTTPKSLPLTGLEDVLRSARSWLKELRNNAPPFYRSAPLTRFKVNRTAIALDKISGLLDLIGSMKYGRDSVSHAALVAKQERIVSELKQQVEMLEKQDREIIHQIKDKVQERKWLTPE